MTTPQTAAAEDFPTTAVIGLGRIGTAIARKLMITGTVFGWDVRDSARRALAAEGLLVRAPGDHLATCQSILLCLSTPQVTREVFQELVPYLRPGTVIVDTSTSDPATARALEEIAASIGSYFLDAPILGRPSTCGQWTLPVGGDAQALELVRPVLAQLANRIYYVGEVGSGHAVKLLNNLMFAAINAVTAEVVGACEYLDLDPQSFYDIVSKSAAATVSPLFLELVPAMIAPKTEPVFTVELLRKDIRLAVSMCEAHDVPLLLTRTLQAITDLAIAQGIGNEDSAALVRLYRKRA